MNRNEAWLQCFPELGGGPCKRHGWGGGAVDADGVVHDGLCPSCARYAYNGACTRVRDDLIEALDIGEILREIVAPVMSEDVQVQTEVRYNIQLPHPINDITLNLMVDGEEDDDGKEDG